MIDDMMQEAVVYKLPTTTAKRNKPSVVSYEYYIFAPGLGFLTPVTREDWATSISNGAMAFDDPFDLCHYVKDKGWKIMDGPSEIMAEWIKVEKKES